MEIKKLRNTLVSKKILLKPRDKLPDIYLMVKEQINGDTCIREKKNYRRSSLEEIKQSLPNIPGKYILRSPPKKIIQQKGAISTIRKARNESMEQDEEYISQYKNKNRSMLTLNNEFSKESLHIQKFDQIKNKFSKLLLSPLQDQSFGGWPSKSSQSISK